LVSKNWSLRTILLRCLVSYCAPLITRP
jgi:hypothetical protein